MARSAEVTVERLALPRAFVGCSTETCEAEMFRDAGELARRLGGVKESIEGRLMPVVTAVVVDEAGPDGHFRYFTGDEVQPGAEPLRRAVASAEGLESTTIPAGTLTAHVDVRVGTQTTLPLRIAAARKAFYEQWLPSSGYVASTELGFRDVELYHYRKRRFRRATKLVVELLFIIEEAK